MKKKTYLSCLAALGVLASFTSCSESESLEHSGLSDDRIVFSTTLDNSWASPAPASSSRAAQDAAKGEEPIVVPTSYGKPLYLHSIEQGGIHIWSRDGKRITRSGAPLPDGDQESAVQTRGAQKTELSQYNSFGVSAWYMDNSNTIPLFQKDGNPYIAIATPFDNNKYWEVKDSRWPKYNDAGIQAFAPYSADATPFLAFQEAVAAHRTKITYTALAQKDEIAKQPDLIVATALSSDSRKVTNLKFKHALTAVTFAISKDLAAIVGSGKKLTKVELRGIPNKGTCTLAFNSSDNYSAYPQWAVEKDVATYTFDFSDQDIIVGQADRALTLGDSTLMMIPQTLPEGAEVHFTLTKDGQEEEFKIPLKGKSWNAGTSIIYKLSAYSVDRIWNTIMYDNSWNKTDKDGSGNFVEYFPQKGFYGNDAAGVYILNRYNELVRENVKLVATNGGSSFDPSGGKIPYMTSCKYFVYYPYSEDKQNVNLNAETAEEFFADKIQNHPFVNDQSKWAGVAKADLQVGRIEFNAAGNGSCQLKHQVGLAVMDMNSYTGVGMFDNDSYLYFYGKTTQKPVAGTDFRVCQRTDRERYLPSTNFIGNKPYLSVDKKVTYNPDYYSRYVFIVPFGKSAEFKAENEQASKLNNSWGYDSNISLSPTKDKPLVKTNIEADVPLFKIQRRFWGIGSLQTFHAPQAGEYLMECWGSEGGFPSGFLRFNTGNPGCSYGLYTAKDNQEFFICCGDAKGYNNGKSKGVILPAGVCWGGGGSQIAIKKEGTGETCYYTESQINESVLLIAGGAGSFSGSDNKKRSGNGGGLNGTLANRDDVVYMFNNLKEPRPGLEYAIGGNYLGGIGASEVVSTQIGIGGVVTSWPSGGSQGGGGFCAGGGGPAGYPGAGGGGFINKKLLKNFKGIDGSGMKNKPDYSPLKESVSLPEEGCCRISWILKKSTFAYDKYDHQ